MKLMQSLLAFALVSTMGTAAAVTPGYLGNLSGQTVSIGSSFLAGSLINDVYTFDILPLSTTVGTAVTINLDIPQFAGEEFEISNFMIEFRDSANNLLAFDNALLNNALSISADLAAAMGYQFIVSGNVTGTLGGSYGGALAAAPVPEAGSYAMMLAGLGLVGFMVVRRRSV